MRNIKIIGIVVLLLQVAALLSSCKTVAPIVTTPHNDSIVIKYEYLHDSIFIDRAHFEFLKGDSVYIHDTVTKTYFSIVNRIDTIYRDKEVVVTLPPEKYIPAFYKWCTGILIAIGVLLIIYVGMRVLMRVYLHK